MLALDGKGLPLGSREDLVSGDRSSTTYAADPINVRLEKFYNKCYG